MDCLCSADMGNRSYRHCRPACSTLRRITRQKAAGQETAQERSQKGHERGNGRQGRTNVGGVDVKGGYNSII